MTLCASQTFRWKAGSFFTTAAPTWRNERPCRNPNDAATPSLSTNGTLVQPLIVTVAAVGAELTPEQTPHLPITPQQLGETAALCRAAGASMIHVHCRNDDGSNTSAVERFEAAYAAIRERSDLIVQFTTGGAIGMSAQERAAPLRLRPEMATLTCGTVNFGDEVFENSFPLMRGIVAEMQRYGVRPELEIFDAGHLANAKRLAAEGTLALPQHVDFVLGVPGALGCLGAQPALSYRSLAGRVARGLWRGSAAISCRLRRSRSRSEVTCVWGSRTISTTPKDVWRATMSSSHELPGLRANSGGQSRRPRKREGSSACSHSEAPQE